MKIIQFNSKKPNLEMIASVMCSPEFKAKFNLMVDKTRKTGYENLFYVSKNLGEKEGFVSDVYSGKKTKISITSIYNLFYDADKMAYTSYPLITVHTHPKKLGLPIPSPPDLYVMLCSTKEHAKREFFEINPFLIIANEDKETSIVQDKSNILHGATILPSASSIMLLDGIASPTAKNNLLEYYVQVEKGIKNKTITTAKAVRMLKEIGFAASTFKGDYDKNTIKKALKGSEFIEKDMVCKIP